MDRLSQAERSRVMSRIRSRDTGPEMLVRRMLYANGYRYRCQWKGVPGHPDVAIPRLRTLIEIRGCFWHRHEGCSDATTPKSNCAFWNEKFRRNVERDARHEKEWSDLGWNLIVVWTCGLVPSEREKTFRFILKTLARWEKGAEKRDGR